MKNTGIKLLSVLLACVMVFTLLPGLFALAETPEIISSGYCGAEGDGTNISWTLDSTGKLTISGTGTMRAAAFNGNNSITAVEIQAGVTGLGTRGFASCYNLESLSIADTVTEIGQMSFHGCKKLQTLVVPGSVQVIGNYAFTSCLALSQVTFCPGVKTVQYESFSHCPLLTEVVFPDSIETISSSAFYACTALTDVTIPADAYVDRNAFLNTPFQDAMPDGMIYLGGTAYTYRGTMPENTDFVIQDGTKYLSDSLFRDKTALKSVTMPDSVIRVGIYTFAGCENLTSVRLSQSLTGISSCMFYGCSSLAEINIPSSVTKIDSGAFGGCASLTEIIIPDSVTSFRNLSMFGGCTSLQHLVIGSGVTESFSDTLSGNLTSLTLLEVSPENPVYHSAGNCLIETATNRLVAGCSASVIPDDGSVTVISAYAFQKCEGLTSITIPGTVTEIRASAFESCPDLVSVSLNSGLLSIYAHAFDSCPVLTDINFPDTVTSIGISAFAHCKSLVSVVIPDSVTSLGKEAFRECSGITQVSIGSGLKLIPMHAFYYCTSLTSVTVPDNVTKIDWYAFYHCTSLTSVSFGKGLSVFYARSFEAAAVLDEITVSPENARYMSSGNCMIEKSSKTLVLGGINSVIPDDGSVTTIGTQAFDTRTGLTHITIPEGVTEIEHDAFWGCKGLQEIALPDSLVSVGDSAFYRCENLRTVSLGSGLTSLSPKAFSWSGVEAITLPDQLTSLGDQAFCECHELASIHFGAGITSFPESVFFGTRSLASITVSEDNPTYYAENDCLITKDGHKLIMNCPTADVVIPQGVETIGKLYFYNCYESYTDTLTIPNSVERFESNIFASSSSLKKVYYKGTTAQWNAIENKPVFKDAVLCTLGGGCGENAFWSYADGVLTLTGTGETYDFTNNNRPEWNCYSNEIRTVIVADGITALGNYVFRGLTALDSVSLPDGLLRIGDYAFADCSTLTQITLPESVAAFGSYAFSGATGLTQIVLPAALTEIPTGTFYGCRSLTSVSVPANVTAIGNSAFCYCKSLAEVTFAEGVTRIGTYAFHECSSLTSVTLPDSVAAIGSSAFSCNDALTSVTLGSGVTEIGSSAFEYCKALTDISLPAGLPVIPAFSFRACTGLTAVELPENLTQIGRYAFYGCTALTGITIPSGVTAIPDSAFCGCKALVSADIPAGVASIGEYAFYNCEALTDMALPSGLETIGKYAFGSCPGLTALTVPAGVTAMGNYAFSNCKGLTSLTLTDGMSTIGSLAFMNCTGLTELTVPGSVTNIGRWAFENCSALKKVTFGEGLTQIGPSSFDACRAIEALVLPQSLAGIGAYAFRDSTSLANIFYAGTAEQWAQVEIGDCNAPIANANIHYASTGHTPGEPIYENEIPATCTEPGSRDEVVYCLYCNYEFSRVAETTDPLGHDFFDIPEVAPTCTENGHTAYKMCTRCAIWDPMPEPLYALGHSCGDPVRENEVPATCTEGGGYDLVTYCTVCGEVVSSEHFTEPALGHTFESEITLAPTCTEPGVCTYTCIRCPESYTEAEPALGHGTLGSDVSGAPSTCIVRGYSMTVCLACGEITDYEELPLDPTNHNWGEWVLVTPATYLTEGLEQRTCAWCGETETNVLPALVPEETISDPETGIELQLQEGVLPENTVFEVDEEFDGTYFRLLNREVGNVSSTLYNITPTADGSKVQPDGYVLVRLPIPAGYNPDTLSIYYISTETGVTERMDCYIEDGYICFQTTHFSVYAIVDASAPAQTQTEQPTQPTSGNSGSGSFFARLADWFRNIISLFKNLFKR